ncbi:hypothetical protein RP20_CCG006163 [Aedes albopictus]|nr:hypothetical protein RP20_CCG006163 [Aedes albopictus]
MRISQAGPCRTSRLPVRCSVLPTTKATTTRLGGKFCLGKGVRFGGRNLLTSKHYTNIG